VRVLAFAFALWVCVPAAGFAQTGQASQARQFLLEASALIKDIPEPQRESAVANLSGQLTRAGDLPDALATIQLLEKPDQQAFAMGSVAWELADGGPSAQALFLIQGTKESPGRDVSYEHLALRLVQKGDFEQGLRVAHLIREPSRLVESLVRLGVLTEDPAATRRCLVEALDVAEEALQKNPSYAGILNQIAGAQAQIGATPETTVALSRMSAIARKRRDETGDTTLLQALGATEARIGDTAEATQIAQELSESSADWVYSSISQEQASLGLMTEALAAASKISAPTLRDSTLREIAMIRRSSGSSNDCFEAINQMSSPSAQAEAIATLALEQASANNAAAYQTLQLWHASTGGGVWVGGKGRETAAVAYGLLGDFVSAAQILDSIREPEARTWPLWNLTKLLVKSGHAQEATELAFREETALPKAYAFLGTAQGLLDLFESQAGASPKNH